MTDKAANVYYLYNVAQYVVNVTFDIHFQQETLIKESNPFNLKFKIACAASLLQDLNLYL